jgi:DNA-binding IclR family transcriptional regulator
VIQVLGRLFTILELLSVEEKATTSRIAASAGLKKTTASNIIRTLALLGYLESNELHEYYFSRKFLDLVEANIGRDALVRAAERSAAALATKVGETVVVGALRQGRYYIIAEATYERTVTVHSNVYTVRPLYLSVTGRVLLAHVAKGARARVMAEAGRPGADWPEAATARGLEGELRTIRRDGLAEVHRDDVYAVAVPVAGVDGIACSVGLWMPQARFSASRRAAALSGLRQASIDMSKALEAVAEDGSDRGGSGRTNIRGGRNRGRK